MYLAHWARLVQSGELLNHDLEIVSDDGRYTRRGPVESVDLECDYLVIAVGWWAYRDKQRDGTWTRQEFNKTVRIHVTYTPPANWDRPGSLRHTSKTYCFRGDQLELADIPS